MIVQLGLAAAGALGVFVWDVAKRYGATSKGENPWTIEAFMNACRLAVHIEKAVWMVDGSINGMYRSAQVNEITEGASKTSLHMHGRAVDIKPGKGFTPESGARFLFAKAQAGELGAVRTIIWEPSWIHIDWHETGTTPTTETAKFIKAVGDGKYAAVV